MAPAGQRAAILPWQAEPYRLWSLYEMLIHLAGNWLATINTLERMRWVLTLASENNSPFVKDFIDSRDENLKWMRDEIACLPFSESLQVQADRVFSELRRVDPTSAFAAVGVSTRIDELARNIQSELKAQLFCVVPASRKSWYSEDDDPLFGQPVADAFPDSTSEIAEAGRCFALARWTACVFHLMRAFELALHKWARELGVNQFNALELENWKNILDAARKKVEALEQQPKSPAKDAELQYYGETRAHFLAIKDAWRNHVAHARVRYDEGRAASIMSHARDFMRILASKP